MKGGVQDICVRDGSGWSFAALPPDNARDRIMSAAAFVVCNHGFAATGIDSILNRAGTAKATL
ncbi:TetR/AcrR family transcriptional regulator [Roseibacterium beibuensis]|uniref:Uncharacterized protein n=1 Tax=[Roseibacterium] beibuensis TaxID=1193142 RepID=A0ABP9KYI0_9RHOB|nr:TetR/AcrR family transcriptional regulator [Roseibacterium beibuensis]MCS6622048.1 TetR/AcrR family transcriptional regulator [Roseibacterium beibuensis]